MTKTELLSPAGDFETALAAFAAGADADLLVLDENLDITSLFAKGRTAMLNGKILMKGRFEE